MRIVRNEIDPLDAELKALREIKADLAKFTEMAEEQSALVASMMADRGMKTTTADGHKFTLVQAERTQVNEEGLRKAIGARLFNTMTVRKLDKAKLEAAVQEGKVDPTVVSMHTALVKNRPSIRITEVTGE